MLKRYGSYFADWRDATGKRHRKAFATLQEAVDYTEQMRAVARPESPNSHPPRPHSRKPRRSTPARSLTTRTRRRRSRRC
jgi:hypothetical protein